MDRRTFIKGSVIAAATPGVVSSADTVEPSMLLGLIAKHETLYNIDSEEWNRLSDIEDAMQDAPPVAVQVGRLMTGRDEDRNRMFTPILARSEDEVCTYFDKHRTQLAYFHQTSSEQRCEIVLRAHDDAKQEKLAELRRAAAERDKYEEACGYKAAREAAFRTMEAVKEVEQLILDYVPASLEEAAIKARWVVKKMNDDRSYLLDHEDALEEALAAIGRA